MPRRMPLLALFSTLAVTLVLGAAPGVASVQQTTRQSTHQRAEHTTESMRLRAAVRALPVAAETPAGYDRDLFRHWVDADGDCQDTREEVLVAESRVSIDGCTISTGRWFSWYDRETWTLSSDVDIDHLVPLKEAWDSGARSWSDGTRERYANDLGDARTLVAVTDNVNQSKGDRDAAEWLPDFNVCRYVRQWVAVKLRWGLAVDAAEKAAVRARARRCSNRVLAYVPATTTAQTRR